MADTKISAISTTLAPASVATGDYVPVARSGGTNAKLDIRALLPPGFAYTQNAANSAEFKSLVMDNDTGFTASPGSVEATSFRLSIGSWNNAGTQNYSNSGLAIGFNCKAVEVGSDFRVDTAKHGLALHFNANYNDTGFSNAAGTEFSAVFIDRPGTTTVELFRFRAGNAPTGTGAHPTGEFVIDARIAVSGVRGARGCDFLGWRSGQLKDCFIQSVRQNNLLYYYDDGTNYPYINMIIKQSTRYRVDLLLGKGGSTDATGTDSSDTTPPYAFAGFGSRPFQGTNFNASTLCLGLSVDDGLSPKDPIGRDCILGVYTGNAVNGTKGLVIRAGRRSGQTANTSNVFEVQSTADEGATGTMTWAWGADGRMIIGSSERITGGNSFTPSWTNIPGGGAPASSAPTWIRVYDGYGGTRYLIPCWAN